MYGPIRRTISTTARFPSPPRSGETTHTGATGFPATGRYPGILAVLKKSRIFASLIAKQGLTKLKRQNESLRNHRKNRRYRKQRFPLGKAYQTNLKTKRFWLEEEGRWITLKVSAAGIKTINKKGLTAALKEAKAPKNLY